MALEFLDGRPQVPVRGRGSAQDLDEAANLCRAERSGAQDQIANVGDCGGDHRRKTS
jgi:hypothetical protein